MNVLKSRSCEYTGMATKIFLTAPAVIETVSFQVKVGGLFVDVRRDHRPLVRLLVRTPPGTPEPSFAASRDALLGNGIWLMTYLAGCRARRVYSTSGIMGFAQGRLQGFSLWRRRRTRGRIAQIRCSQRPQLVRRSAARWGSMYAKRRKSMTHF